MAIVLARLSRYGHDNVGTVKYAVGTTFMDMVKLKAYEDDRY